MKILEKVNFRPFDWVNFDCLSQSLAYKIELFSLEDRSIRSIDAFLKAMFDEFSDDIFIRQMGQDAEWGDFCIDTWDINDDKYDYSTENKSIQTQRYLELLACSEIEAVYSGTCRCNDWSVFFSIVKACVLAHVAPYSVLFYLPKYNFLFYFHHTNTIGVLYQEMNPGINFILSRSKVMNIGISTPTK